VAAASKQAPGQWKVWFWICFAGLLFFTAVVPLLRGRWTTSAAKRDRQEHEELVTAELAKLGT
jgi:hypothetical protein